MEMQVIDIDYVMVDDKVIVRVFGKTEEGKSVCGFVEGFDPYFYAEGQGLEEHVRDDGNVKRIEKVPRKLAGRGEVEVYKITCKNPAQTPELRERLRPLGFVPYEADVLFKYRFMSDHGMGGMGWIRADASPTATNTVCSDLKVQLSNIEVIKREGNAPLKTVAFDIECLSSGGGIPDPKNDPVILISLVFSEPYKNQDSIILSTRAGEGVLNSSTEKEMLDKLMTILAEYDPDIITGYNVNGFDLPFILERMRKNGIKPTFGRCEQKSVMNRKVGLKSRTIIAGRVVADSFELVKRGFSLTRYSLDAVCRELIGKEKENVKVSEMESLWKGDQDGFNRFVSYCRTDSVLALNLLSRLDLLGRYMAIARVSGTLLQDAMDSGETTRIENFLMREFNREGYIMPCKPDGKEIGRRQALRSEELKGGFVLDPIKDLHSSVVVLDFKSMYPSIIRSFNMCPTTVAREGAEGAVNTLANVWFYPEKVRKGILPRILTEMMEMRGAAKKRMRECKDEEKRKILDGEQWALKIMANAFYGYLGYVRARLFSLEIAQAITGCGREIIKGTKAGIEKMGYQVVYGDTDSVMVKLPTEDMDEIERLGNKIAEIETKKLPGVMELEFEKVFKRFLPLTKKRYAAWAFEKDGDRWKDKIDTKGIETVRRDWCSLVSETLMRIIEIILKEDDVKGAVKFFRGVVKDLSANKIPIQKLVVTKTMTKSPEHYAGAQPHIEAAKKMRARDPAEAPGVGDRVSYVIVKGTQLVSKRAEDPVYVVEKGIQIDSSYYIDNQILPPIERIFSALGITKSELVGNGKQMGLMVFNGAKQKDAQEPKPLAVVNRGEMTGFLCQKCSSFFERPPLLGVCPCGGQLSIATRSGPALAVKA